jgi:hypothetical protein
MRRRRRKTRRGISMKISRKTRLIGAAVVVAVAGTVGGLVATDSGAKPANPLCTPVALSNLMGYWQDKQSQATSNTDMQAIYGAGIRAELQRGKLCHLQGFG